MLHIIYEKGDLLELLLAHVATSYKYLAVVLHLNTFFKSRVN